MKKKLYTCIIWIISFLFFSSALSSCQYYKYNKLSNSNPSEYINKKKSSKLFKNHFIFHSGGELMELTNVKIDKNEEKISGKLILFTGLERDYYDNVRDNKRKLTKRKTGRKHRLAVKQFHIYVDQNFIKNEFVDGHELSIINFDDISKIELLKNDFSRDVILIGIPVVVGAVITAAANSSFTIELF